MGSSKGYHDDCSLMVVEPNGAIKVVSKFMSAEA